MLKRNKKIRMLIVAGLISVSSIGIFGGVKSHATDQVPFENVNGVDQVSVMDLAKALDTKVDKLNHPWYGEGIEFVLNGKLFTIFENSHYLFVDGLSTPYATQKAVDYTTGEEFITSKPKTPDKKDGQLVVPVTVLAQSFDMKVDDKGVVLPADNNSTGLYKYDAKKEEQKAVQDTTKEQSKNTENKSDTKSVQQEQSKQGTQSHVQKQEPTKKQGHVQKQEPVKPTPQPPVKKEEPKPVVKEDKVTGMSYSSYRNQLGGLGFKYDPSGDSYDFYSNGGISLGGVRVLGNGAYFMLMENSPSFDNAIRRSFNMLLPTQGNKLYNMVANGCQDQTVKMDGRTVSISQSDVGVAVHIEG